MATLGENLHSWTLKLSSTKIVSAIFHLNNKEAKLWLKVNYNCENLVGFLRAQTPRSNE